MDAVQYYSLHSLHNLKRMFLKALFPQSPLSQIHCKCRDSSSSLSSVPLERCLNSCLPHPSKIIHESLKTE